MQFRIMDLLLTVWVWGNATGILYLGSRWMVEPHAAQPTFNPLALAVFLVISGLWVLEGSWWALSREKEIQSVLGWQRRWPMLLIGWMRLPVIFSGAMLTLMVPTWSVTMYKLDRLNSTGLMIFSILTLLMLLSWVFIFYWWKIRKAHDLKLPPIVKHYHSGVRGGAKEREFKYDEENEEPQHKNV